MAEEVRDIEAQKNPEETTVHQSPGEQHKAAGERLKALLREGKKINPFQSTLPSLKERYRSTQSQLTQIALWYKDQSILNKLFYSASAVTLALTIGTMLNAAFLLTIMTIGVYSFVHTLLVRHAQTLEEQESFLFSGLVNREEQLEQIIESASIAEDKLRTLFSTEGEAQLSLAESREQLEEEVSQLSVKVRELNQNVQGLQQDCFTLIESKSALISDIQQKQALLNTLQDTLSADVRETHEASLNLSAKFKQLNNGIAELHELEEALQKQNQTQNAIEHASTGCQRTIADAINTVDAALEAYDRYLEEMEQRDRNNRPARTALPFWNNPNARSNPDSDYDPSSSRHLPTN